jgi:hypothetical protein
MYGEMMVLVGCKYDNVRGDMRQLGFNAENRKYRGFLFNLSALRSKKKFYLENSNLSPYICNNIW